MVVEQIKTSLFHGRNALVVHFAPEQSHGERPLEMHVVRLRSKTFRSILQSARDM